MYTHKNLIRVKNKYWRERQRVKNWADCSTNSIINEVIKPVEKSKLEEISTLRKNRISLQTMFQHN